MKYVIDDCNEEFDTEEEVADRVCQIDDYEDGQYADDLDDIYGKVEIAGHEFWTSTAFKLVDERAFDEGFVEWAENRLYDDKHDLIYDLRRLGDGEELDYNGYTIRCEYNEEERAEEEEKIRVWETKTEEMSKAIDGIEELLAAV